MAFSGARAATLIVLVLCFLLPSACTKKPRSSGPAPIFSLVKDLTAFRREPDGAWRLSSSDGEVAHPFGYRLAADYVAICEPGWTDAAADLVCKWRGFAGGRAATSGVYGTEAKDVLTDFTCPPGATSVRQCSATLVYGGNCTSLVALTCSSVQLPDASSSTRTSATLSHRRFLHRRNL